MDANVAWQAADRLYAARKSGTPVAPLPEEHRPVTVDDGYRVQDRLHERMAGDRWGSIAGFKIGCTTPPMQEYLGIDHPCAGGIWSESLHVGSATLDRADYVDVGVEGELAVTIGTPVLPSDTVHDRESITRFVRSWHAAIEVVDNRYGDFLSFGAPTLIADDFFGAGGVIGPATGPHAVTDIAAVEGRLTADGEFVGGGAGAAILGHPLEALAWLANQFSALGRTIADGSVVLLGSLFRVYWVEQGTRRLVFDVPPLGSVEASFGASPVHGRAATDSDRR